MNSCLQSVEVEVWDLNQIAAELTLQVRTVDGSAPASGWRLSAAAFEIGVDQSRPDSPLAVSDPLPHTDRGGPTDPVELRLRIGTPFRWQQETHPRYAIVITAAGEGEPQCGEIQFGFNHRGEVVVTEPFKRIFRPPPALNPGLPSLFVVGDSTAFSNGRNQRGWGDELGGFFEPAAINIRNRARPGRSTRSYRNEGLWSRVVAEMKAGDWVLIQFGHNDADKLGEGRCRGVLPGSGDETQNVTMPGGRMEAVHTFGWYLCQFIVEAKAMGAIPLLLSPTPRNVWQEGKLLRRQSDYGVWSQSVAAKNGVPFMDATGIIADRYDALGREKVQALFCDESDNVHTNPAGARLNAECVARGLSQLPGQPLRAWLKPLP